MLCLRVIAEPQLDGNQEPATNAPSRPAVADRSSGRVGPLAARGGRWSSQSPVAGGCFSSASREPPRHSPQREPSKGRGCRAGYRRWSRRAANQHRGTRMRAIRAPPPVQLADRLERRDLRPPGGRILGPFGPEAAKPSCLHNHDRGWTAVVNALPVAIRIDAARGSLFDRQAISRIVRSACRSRRRYSCSKASISFGSFMPRQAVLPCRYGPEVLRIRSPTATKWCVRESGGTSSGSCARR